MSTRLARWGPPLVWMAVIFAASHQSRLGAAARVPDWISHGAAYGMLAFLIARAVEARVLASWPVAALVVAWCTLYGVTDEIHQGFVPGRHADAWDVLKDFAGSLAGLLAFRWVRSRSLAPSSV
jgi:VanZ family protein